MSYVQISLKGVRSCDEDLVSGLCFEHGALGVSEALQFTQTDGEEDIISQPQDRTELSAYFEQAPQADFFETVKSRYPDVVVQVSTEEARDWLQEWKKGFEPFELVTGVWVVPSWLEAPPEAKLVLHMDPGMAFGTGTHETTKLMARGIIHWFKEQNSPRVLDVGTGTGVLAMLAVIAGASEVVAIDHDEEAVRVAQENVVRNHMESHVQVSRTPLEQVEGHFDLIVANIIDGVLVRMRPELERCLAKGGVVLVSGILEERRADFLAHMNWSDGFIPVYAQRKGDWWSFGWRRS